MQKDIQLAQRVRSGDAAIDALQGLINEEAARVIALRAPTAVDLWIILSVIKVSANLKRIGDYAKNVAKRTGVLIQMNAIQDASNALRRLGSGVELMLKDALDAYVQKDLALAEDIISRDNDVDQMYERLFRQFITYRMEDPRNITGCMYLHFMAKNIERIGDHVTSITEQVIFIVTGELPSEPLNKADETSSFKA